MIFGLFRRTRAHQVPILDQNAYYDREHKIRTAIEAEMRPGGRPISTYNDLNAVRELSYTDGAAITTRMLRNLEDRIVALELEGDAA